MKLSNKYENVALIQKYICFTCGNISNDKTMNMNHIKTVHGGTPCRRFEENKCYFSSKDCIYNHILLNKTHQTQTQTNQHHQTQAQDFWKGQMNSRPSGNPQGRAQVVNISDMIPQLMNNMMHQMTQMAHILSTLNSGSQ